MMTTLSPTRHALKWGLRIALLMIFTYFSLIALAHIFHLQIFLDVNPILQLSLLAGGLHRSLQQRRKQVNSFRFQEVWSLGTMLSGIISVLVGLGVMLGMILYIFIFSPSEVNSPSQLFMQIVISLAFFGIIASFVLAFLLRK